MMEVLWAAVAHICVVGIGVGVLGLLAMRG